MRVRQRQILVAETRQQRPLLRKFYIIERNHRHVRKGSQKCQEFDSSARVVTLQEPSVRFGNHQCVRQQARRCREGCRESRVVAAGSIQEGK